MKALLFTVLSRGLLILVLLALGLGYYYRAALFPGYFAEPATTAQQPAAATPEVGQDASSTSAADAVPELPKATEGSATAPQEQQPTPSAPQPAATTEPSAPAQESAVVVTVTEPAPQEPAVNASQPVTAGEPSEPEQGSTVAVSETEPAPSAGASPTSLSGEGVQWPEPQDAAQAEATEDEASAAEPATGNEDGRTPLERARSAYWAGNVKEALAAYQEAVAADPEDPDAQGELGNLHFAEGNWQGAADAYLAAGLALLARGDANAADHLVVVLEGLDPEHAKRLREAIDAQRSDQR